MTEHDQTPEEQFNHRSRDLDLDDRDTEGTDPLHAPIDSDEADEKVVSADQAAVQRSAGDEAAGNPSVLDEAQREERDAETLVTAEHPHMPSDLQDRRPMIWPIILAMVATLIVAAFIATLF